jgi:hypothetical protein
MKLTFEEKLPNLLKGSVNKISTEIEYETKENGDATDILGKFLIIREVKTENRVTEIRDHLPVEISISKRKLINKTKAVTLNLEGFRFELEGNFTTFLVDIELNNVEDYGASAEKGSEFVFEQI